MFVTNSLSNNLYTATAGINRSCSFLAVETMICVYPTQGAKHGQDQLERRLWMNGDPGLLMNKLQGMYSPLINKSEMFYLSEEELYSKSTEIRLTKVFYLLGAGTYKAMRTTSPSSL